MINNGRTNRINIFDGVDFKTVFLYIALTIVGVLCITSASYDASDAEFFSFAHNHTKQLMWVGIAWVTAFVVMMLDSRYFHMLAYPAYLGGILLLVAVLIFGREVNGAKAWFQFGSIRVQPVEFAKIAIALAVARMMSGYSFSINRPSNLFRLGAMLLLPLAIIVLQNDTGSGIVLGSFLFVFYREGLNKWLCIPILLVALLFIVSFLVAHGIADCADSGLYTYRGDDESPLAQSCCGACVGLPRLDGAALSAPCVWCRLGILCFADDLIVCSCGCGGGIRF